MIFPISLSFINFFNLPLGSNRLSYAKFTHRMIMGIFTQLPAYQTLQEHAVQIATEHMADWFAKDTYRFENFSLKFEELLLDYSKNRISQKTLDLLFTLAGECNLTQKIDDLFSGDLVNFTEKRAALHTSLRNHKNSPHVQDTLEKMRSFVNAVHKHQHLGATGKPFTDIVNIGIGGSHLGPMMTTQALSRFAQPGLRCHFISNIDDLHIQDVLNQINPETTLFIVSSKTFTTIETMTNAKFIYTWLQQKLGTSIQNHFVAVTAHPENALKFGIPEKQIFTFWDWVGGRYSIWSAIGLPLALMIGMENFLEFLAGAHAMDIHFRETPYEKNMPVILALLGIWYINFFNSSQHAIIPYSHSLDALPDYIQQLDMESNGKRIHLDGHEINYTTGPVIIGKQGCDGQHSFFQLLHQGQQLIPVDFVLVGKDKQDLLIASALSQAQALMQGKTKVQAHSELLKKGFSENDASYLSLHQCIPGNQPSNIIFLDKISPYNLGALIALYEHKIFVQGVIWGINSFDQWGVELGKQLLPQILSELQQDDLQPQQDASTYGLIMHYKKLRTDA